MTVHPKTNTTPIKYCTLVIVSLLMVIIGFINYGCMAMSSLMSAEELQYNNPNQSQIDHFLECCGLINIPIDSADYIVVSKSPHKSDSLMYMVFDGDIIVSWHEFINNPNPEDNTIKLPCEHSFNYDSMKQISPFVRVYNLAMNDAGKSLLIVTNVSSEIMNQLAELGSGDYIKNTEGKYELNPDSFVCDTAESPEEKWWLLHADSKNEIDLAIKYSVELASKEAPTIYSSISPRSSEAILTAMSALSPSCYPEVWERICIEPAYRAQKIVALEQFLGVFFDDLGLYDHLAQRKWFDSFNALRQEISDQSFEQISKADYAQYGNLLLPMLAQKSMDNTLHESELKVLGEMIENMNKQFHPSLENASITSTKAASEWFDAHLSTIEAISEIIQSNYTWVE